MANQKIRRDPDWDIRETGSTNGWQQGNLTNQSDMGKGREIRADPDASDPLLLRAETGSSSPFSESRNRADPSGSVLRFVALVRSSL